MKTFLKSLTFVFLAVVCIAPMGSMQAFAAISSAKAPNVKVVSSVPTSATSATVEDFYLLSPTLVAHSSGVSFVFDSASNKLKTIQNEQIVLSETLQTAPIRMVAFDSNLFVFFQNKIELRVFDNSQQTPTLQKQTLFALDKTSTPVPSSAQFNFQNVFQTAYDFAVVQESQNAYSVFVQAKEGNNLEIQKLDVAYHPTEQVFTCDYTNTIYNSVSLAGNQISSPVLRFGAIETSSGYSFLCATQTSLHLVQTDPTLTCTTLSSTQALAVVGTSTGFAYTTTNGTILTNEDGVQTNTSNLGVSSLASENQSVFGAIESSAQVVQIFPSEQVVFKNNFTAPQQNSWNTAQNLAYLTTNKSTLLKEFPYSISGISLPAGTDLVVLAGEQESYPQMAYVTLVWNQGNIRGFVSLQDVSVLSASAQNISVRTLVDSKLFTIPSAVEDAQNVVVENLPKDSTLKVIHNVACIQNGGNSFLFVETQSGKTGFVLSSNIGSLLQNKKQKKSANATVVRDTYLCANPDGTSPQLLVQKDTRVKISGKLNPKIKYTRVTFQGNDGSTYEGYIKTADLVSDGLTTLQIVGVVLLSISGVVLLFVVAFWIKAKKYQTK